MNGSQPVLTPPPPALEATSPWPFRAGLLVIGGLLISSFAPVLYRLGEVWLSDDNMSHGLFVPLTAAYIAYLKRGELAAAQWKTNYLGLLLVVLGGLMLCVGPPSIPTFIILGRVAFLFSLTGCLLFLGGFRILWTLAYPLSLLPLMIPFPFYDFVTLPLQLVASILSEHSLSALGVSVLREGNVLFLSGQTLSVAEACSGLRSLYSLLFLTLAYAYFFADTWKLRAALIAAIIPIAIVANSMRVTATAILGGINPEYTHGVYHEMLGWSVFVVAFGMLCLWHWCLMRGEKLFARKGASV
ncbi:MAG TPA: exosortase [Solibacterales bacterium]|nr:exosortase [Bryobacterales bacterium]